MTDTEKITINMRVVDLGKIDLLVDQGYFSNRSDLIRTAIREKLSEYDDTVKEEITRRSIMVGVMLITKGELERAKAQGIHKEYVVVGTLSIARDITAELALETIESLRVYGVLSASEELKKALGDRIK
jgi:metal-responsive CopG/Arc/MetJ family transcriptional regulator